MSAACHPIGAAAAITALSQALQYGWVAGAMQVSARTRAVLEHRLHLSRLPDHDAAALLLLRGLMELCVYPPTSAAGATGGEGPGANHLPVSWSCTDEAVSQVPPLPALP